MCLGHHFVHAVCMYRYLLLPTLSLSTELWSVAGLVIPPAMISALPPADSPFQLPVSRLALLDGDVPSVFELSWPITKSLLFAKWLFSSSPLLAIRNIPFLADMPYSIFIEN